MRSRTIDGIVEAPLMSGDADVVDSLSRAIADFREKVVVWIDGTLVRLREREQEERLAAQEKSAPAALASLRIDRGSPTGSTETVTQPQSPPMDSLKRLDALARVLDRRLKVSEEAAPNSSGASGRAGKSNG